MPLVMPFHSFVAAPTLIAVHFNHIHTLYPLLDRKGFEEKVASTQHSYHLQVDPSFSALYHAVVALRCQYQDGGPFYPGKGMLWKIYQTSLGLLSEVRGTTKCSSGFTQSINFCFVTNKAKTFTAVARLCYLNYYTLQLISNHRLFLLINHPVSRLGTC
jgi:hypothetical protein